MHSSEPFQLTADEVRRAGLSASDVGKWCLLVNGCYHLFDSEAQAQRAYELLADGVFVR